jgi:hypothetical protein
MAQRRFLELPIQIFNKQEKRLLQDADPNIDPDWIDSIIAIDSNEIESISRSEDTCNVHMKSGKTWWVQMGYPDVVRMMPASYNEGGCEFVKAY